MKTETTKAIILKSTCGRKSRTVALWEVQKLGKSGGWREQQPIDGLALADGCENLGSAFHGNKFAFNFGWRPETGLFLC